MSFNTGGHIIYLGQPKKTSTPHAIQAAYGTITVFTTVPADGDPIEPEGAGTVVPEPLISGRIVG